jgi:hypothetical protein
MTGGASAGVPGRLLIQPAMAATAVGVDQVARQGRHFVVALVVFIRCQIIERQTSSALMMQALS